jgi:hypothetical protein
MALRSVGSEVIISTKSYRSDNATFLKSRGDSLKIIADRHGCALSDTWMYFLEKERSGATVFSDSVHQDADGHEAYAEAHKGILSPAIKLPAKGNIQSNTRVFGAVYQSNNAVWVKYPNYCQVQFAPSETSGDTNQACTATSDLTNPALLFGGRTSSNAVTTLTTGEFATYSHAWATSIDLIVDGSSAFTADVMRNNMDANPGGTLGTISFSATTSGQIQVLEGIDGGDYCDVSTNFRMGRGVQLVCTSGTMKIIGAIFHCDKMKELDILTDVTYTGTWGTEAYIFNHPISRYSDTDGNNFSFSFIQFSLTT